MGTHSPMILPEISLEALGTYFSHAESLQLFKEPLQSPAVVGHRVWNRREEADGGGWSGKAGEEAVASRAQMSSV